MAVVSSTIASPRPCPGSSTRKWLASQTFGSSGVMRAVPRRHSRISLAASSSTLLMKASALCSSSVREFIARRLVRYASTGLKRGGERPITGVMAFDIDAALRYVVEREGSDLHIKVASPPMARVHGALKPIEDSESLSEEETEAALEHILSDAALLKEFADEGEVDFSYEIRGLSRFRVNAFRQRGWVSIACRAIPFQVRTIDDLGLPEVIRELAEQPRGIVLLTGTTGSGKSTTLAAMIDHINSTRSRHVVTLEDPIEYLHRDKLSIINQREVGQDTESFARAMRRVLRQDPDVILIGEMRDEETVRTALAAAETGHLVLSTLHTLDASETINRIIDFFPPHLQQQARVM